MRVKKEVRDICLAFRKTKIGSKEFEELKKVLLTKYKFTPFNLLALFQSPSTIEYNSENIHLVTE